MKRLPQFSLHARTTILSAAAITWLALAWSVAVLGQVTNATVVGTAKDSADAVLPGTQVVVKNLATGIEARAISADDGAFVIPNVPAGHYSITYSHSGFRTFVIPDVELLVAQRAVFDAKLEIGEVTSTITVNEASPLIETSSSDVGQVVNTVTIEHAPLNGRSFWQLTSLTPGVTYTPGGQGTHTGGSSIRSSAVAVNINGGPANQTGWSLDGAWITEMQSGGTLIQPDVDALQEFNVQSAGLPAEYGKTANLVNVSIKSGTNEFHGSAFEFFRNTVLDARNYFYLPPAGSRETRPLLRRNQYGGTIGGPIVKNRTFFFTDIEKTDLASGTDFSNVVPAPEQHSGDFSALLKLPTPVQLKNPATGQPFPNNQIQNYISPQGAFFAPYMPEPNQLRGNTNYNTVSAKLLQHIVRADAKVDHEINQKNHMFGRYSLINNDEQDPNPFTTLGSFSLYSRGQSATATAIHNWSPNWITEARMSYYRSIFIFGGVLQGTNIDQKAGVQGFNDTTSVYGFPQITLSGYAGYNGSPSDQRPKSNQHRNFQYALDTTWIHGKHNAKFGADLLHERASFYNGSRAVGVFNFSGIYSGNAFADMLLGYPDSVTRDYYKQLNGDMGYYFDLFAQDSFRATDKLTLNYGFRVERNTFYEGINGQKSAFNTATGQLIVPSDISPNAQPLTPTLLPLFSDRIVHTSALHLPNSIEPAEWDFVPRFGFAYAATKNTVMRGGYGIYQLFIDLGTINNEVATVPFVASVTISNDRPPAKPSRTWGDYFLGQPNVAPNPNPGAACAFGFVANSCATPDMTANEVRSKNQYVEQWNAAVQHQFGNAVSLDLTYIGTKTTHLQKAPSINDPLPGPGAIQARRPYPQWGVITYNTFGGYANYNALQAKFETRQFGGLTLLGSYTYSRCLDNATGFTSAYQPHSYASCDYDFPQDFTGSFNYAIPFGTGQRWRPGNRLVNAVLGEYQLAGVITARNGAPFTPTISTDTANTGVGSQWPQRIGIPKMIGSPACWFFVSANPSCGTIAQDQKAAFALPAQYTYGNDGRNVLRAGNLVEVDMTLLKEIKFRESRNLELRFEGFNVLNHPSFAAPTTTINTGSGGQVSSTINSSRILQASAKVFF
ncbi:MAG TPA: carboxypeptidase regulatory-like domain-containing protein [Terracidiphilus sp.]|nr:carboxypeptidase regulatory-like domain-containing protein [Terracidiphilus sp.]